MVRRSSNGVLLPGGCMLYCKTVYPIVMCSRIGRVHHDWYGEERARWGVVIALQEWFIPACL